MAEDDNVQQLASRLLNDDTLRERFRRSPHEVLGEHGIELSDDQHRKLSDLDLPSKSDDEVKGMLQPPGTMKMTML